MATARYAFPLNHPNFPSTITHMEWKEISWHNLIPVIESCKGLESLSFRQPHWEMRGDDADSVAVNLDYLKVLKCDLQFGPHYLATMSTRWSMPRLQQVIFMDFFQSLSNIKSCEMFCNRHGHGLRYLHLTNATRGWRSTNFESLQLQPILDSCPVLEHLVLLDMKNTLTLVGSLKHPSLVWMDVWTNFHHFDGSRASIEAYLDDALGTVHNLPSLRNMRLLDWNLIFLTELPALCHPRDFMEDDNNDPQYQYPGIQIRCTKHFVFRDDSEYISDFYDPFDVNCLDSDAESSGDFDGDTGVASLNNASEGDDSSDGDVDTLFSANGEDLVEESKDLYQDIRGRTKEEQEQQEHWEPDFDTVLAINVEMLDT